MKLKCLRFFLPPWRQGSLGRPLRKDIRMIPIRMKPSRDRTCDPEQSDDLAWRRRKNLINWLITKNPEVTKITPSCKLALRNSSPGRRKFSPQDHFFDEISTYFYPQFYLFFQRDANQAETTKYWSGGARFYNMGGFVSFFKPDGRDWSPISGRRWMALGFRGRLFRFAAQTLRR